MAETVTVYTRRVGGEDERGDRIETWEPHVIEGALVYELKGSGLDDADRPDGANVKARVQLPDEAMAVFGRDALRRARIALTGRGQSEEDAFDVIGSPNFAPDLPTEWNTTIELGRVYG